MAEDLITDLSKISNLYVAARNSSFSFKGQMPDLRDVAEKLGVSYVLEGSVRKMGERLRINAQLIDAADGDHLWAERYDGDMAEISDFQDRIRAEIVAALKLKLTPSDQTVAERKPTDSVAAYDLFLKGRASYHRFTHEDILEARKYLEKAIETDPDFADAYGFLSYCYFQGWTHMWPDFDNNLDRANELAERAVVLDGGSAIALARLAWVQIFFRRYDPAIANLEKAIDLEPDNAEVNTMFGHVLNYWGDPERGLKLMEKAFAIDTFAPPNWDIHVGLSNLLLGKYDEALAALNRSIERAPKYYPAYMFLCWAYVE
jgi:adenylate cyclase